nr:hypothetical protein GTC16762_32390 [Pigmentibacter ruber]
MNKIDSYFNLASTELNLSPNDFIYEEACYDDKIDGLEQLIFISKDMKYIYLFNEYYDFDNEVAVDFTGKYKINEITYDESSDFENELHLFCDEKEFDFYNVEDMFDLDIRDKLFNAVFGNKKAA